MGKVNKYIIYFQIFRWLCRFSIAARKSALHISPSAPPPPTPPPSPLAQPLPPPQQRAQCRRRLRQRRQQGPESNLQQLGLELGVQRLGHDAELGRRRGGWPDRADGVGGGLGRGGGGRGRQRRRWDRTSRSRHRSGLPRKRSVWQVTWSLLQSNN